MNVRRLSALTCSLLLAACATQTPVPTPTTPPVSPPTTPQQPPVKPSGARATYHQTSFATLPGWQDGDTAAGWQAWLISCRTVARRAGWGDACAASAGVNPQDPAAIRQFFETRFTPWQLADGQETAGMITGYYEPLLTGSRTRTAQSTVPLYPVPNDLISVDLASVYPQLNGLRLRGRLVGRKLVPYWTAGDIADGKGVSPGSALVWVNDPVEAIFLQIQGSGRVQLPDGSMVRVGYADQNGQPYNSIGRYLIDKGELKASDASMQGIKAWAKRNPERLKELYTANPSYVFFRDLGAAEGGPLGAMGLPLTDGGSIAVDPKSTPLGAPVWLSTTQPNSNAPLRRLVGAQDTGGAIKGAVRADFFWGFGDEAGAQAGRMKQRGQMWLLLPNGVKPPQG